MSSPSSGEFAKPLRSIAVDSHRPLIREASYLRGLVGLPPVRAEEPKGEGERKHEGDPKAALLLAHC